MVWQATICWQGLSALPPFAGAPWSAGCSAASCFIIGQSGGQGSQGCVTAAAGPPLITSMIAASKANRRPSFSIELKMTTLRGEGKAGMASPG
jgi:hypothetical protein